MKKSEKSSICWSDNSKREVNMKEILENSLTIEEKSKGFITGNKIDYSYLTEWRNVRTLLNDHYFNIM